MDKIIKKAWRATADDIVEKYMYYEDDFIVYANTRGEAKSKGLSEMLHQCVQVEENGVYPYDGQRDPEFTDIRVSRKKEYDLVEYRGEHVRRDRVKHIIWCDERDTEAKKIMEENPDGVAVVWAGVYGAYWGSNRAGYCSDIAGAGKYSTQEAFDIVRGSDYSRQEKVILLDESYNKDIDKRIEKLNKEIKLLESKKICLVNN